MMGTSNHSGIAWNNTNRPPGLESGYVLAGEADRGARHGSFICCANETDGEPGESGIGYWTNYFTGTYATWMFAKWIVGRPLQKLYPIMLNDYRELAQFIWVEEPKVLIMNCTPIIEKADSLITVDVTSGLVQTYQILDEPKEVVEAWSDRYLRHNTSADYAGEWLTNMALKYNKSKTTNLTTSFGYMFWDGLLNAGRSSEVTQSDFDLDYHLWENLGGRWFDFRTRGLNVDVVSYSMLALANNSKEALLDPETYRRLADLTFGTFFKHFASENVTTSAGGNAYQLRGENLPWSLGDVMYGNERAAYQGAMTMQTESSERLETTNATLHIPIEQLTMSPLAAYLCISLLTFLVVVTSIMYTVNHAQYKALPRDVDTLASVLGWVYASDKLLAWTHTVPLSRPWYRALFIKPSEFSETFRTAQMGPFRSADGEARWGIELKDSQPASPNSIGRPSSEGHGEWIELRATTNVARHEFGDIPASERPSIEPGEETESLSRT
ncbi:hypothetical protein D6C99_01914 [Aureobasidium pullulans]|nr:hypothetical protein D6C99_01914 [Aureobasidium pullulans]